MTKQLDFDFTIEGQRLSKEARVEYLTGIRPLCGECETDWQLDQAVQYLVKLRRLRFQELRDCGWAPLQNCKYIWARNCRPCAVQVAEYYAQPCRLRTCPFCYGRQMARIYADVVSTMATMSKTHKDLRLIGYRQYRRVERDLNRIYMHGWEDTEPKLLTLWDEIKVYRKIFQAEMLQRGALGGIQWSGYEPELYGYTDEYGAVGTWNKVHAAVVLMSKDWARFGTDYWLADNERQTHRSTVGLIGRAFRYPNGWMGGGGGDANVVLDMLQTVGRTRLLHRFGCFYDRRRRNDC
jgi:hypothetical protein